MYPKSVFRERHFTIILQEWKVVKIHINCFANKMAAKGSLIVSLVKQNMMRDVYQIKLQFLHLVNYFVLNLII